MCPAFALTRSCLPLRAIAAALVAVSVAGCGADMARFDADPFLRARQSDRPADRLSPMSFTGTVSGFGGSPELRPKADLLLGGRSAEIVGRTNSAVRVAALGDQPIRMPPQHSAPRAVSAKRNVEAVAKKEARPHRKSLMAHTRRSPAPPAHKTAGRSVAARVADTDASFDWPVHGRIVAPFGRQRDGQHNGGIDIAVAEDTPIRSAEDGVVIYAGDGLKWYGNLALVRHANNYVTAYAHAKELAVKRGDQVKRGDVIARSGQSGHASTPRVHFEIRKDSLPVDPMPLLKRSSASL
jgi:murein DD-endopeptidase MepM/ murein hydrolase activator NlpD